MSNSEQARHYIFGQMQKVKGFLSPLDGLLLSSLTIHQNSQGWGGSIAEIGVYQGRSYYLFRMMLKDDERCIGMDIFEHGDVRTPYQAFADNGRMLGSPVNVEDIIVGDTMRIDPLDLKERHGAFRFIHIDGCHEFDYVRNDADIADGTLAPYGVICFDDFFNPQYPDVTIAVTEFLSAHRDKYAVIAITQNKLYACLKSHADQYKQAILSAPLLHKVSKLPTQMNGDDILWCSNARSSQIAYKLAAQMNVPTLARMVY